MVARAKISIHINEVSDKEIIVVDELKEIYDLSENAEGIIFKKVDSKGLNAAVRQVKNVLRSFEKSNITETNNLFVASFAWSPDN